MNGIVLGMVMAVGSAGAPALRAPDAAVAPAAFTITVPDEAAPALKLPRDLLIEDPRPLWRLESSRATQASAAKPSSMAVRVIGTALARSAGSGPAA